jgi:hypothetical protein
MGALKGISVSNPLLPNIKHLVESEIDEAQM